MAPLDNEKARELALYAGRAPRRNISSAKEDEMLREKDRLVPAAFWVATVIFAAVFASGGGEKHKIAARHAPAHAVIGSAN